jgi:hypothetical protein
MKPVQSLAFALGLALLSPAPSWAHEYAVLPIAKLFDPAGLIPPDMQFYVGGLNDAGQIAFFAGNPTNSKPEVLLQYSDGKLSKIAEAGKDVPGGKWPRAIRFDAPVSMNQQGCIVFSSLVRASDVSSMGTILWDYPGRRLITVALTGMPAVNNLAFTTGGGPASAINNRNEIALVARVPNAAKASRSGIFFRTPDGKLTPVALPDGDLPGGGKIDVASLASINDAGLIAFLARRPGETADSAYVWSRGEILPVAAINTDVPGGRKLARVIGVWVNNANASILVAGQLDDPANGPGALYRWADERLTPVVVAGQDLPDGGKLKALEAVSAANDAGQHALLVQLSDGSRAVYRLDVNGALTPILKPGTSTEAGVITHLGRDASSFGLALNRQGQLVLGVRINGGIPTLVLLTHDEDDDGE